MATKKKRLGKYWTAHDNKVLRECARRGLSARQAAPRLGRSTGAVKFKAMVEGVHFRAIAQKPGTQCTPEQRQRLSRITAARWRSVRRKRRAA